MVQELPVSLTENNTDSNLVQPDAKHGNMIMDQNEIDTELRKFEENFIKSQQPLEHEFEKVFWDNYWELLA